MGGYHTHRELIVEQRASQTHFRKLREGSESIQAVSLHGCTIDPRKSRKKPFYSQFWTSETLFHFAYVFAVRKITNKLGYGPQHLFPEKGRV